MSADISFRKAFCRWNPYEAEEGDLITFSDGRTQAYLDRHELRGQIYAFFEGQGNQIDVYRLSFGPLGQVEITSDIDDDTVKELGRWWNLHHRKEPIGLVTTRIPVDLGDGYYEIPNGDDSLVATVFRKPLVFRDGLYAVFLATIVLAVEDENEEAADEEEDDDEDGSMPQEVYFLFTYDIKGEVEAFGMPPEDIREPLVQYVEHLSKELPGVALEA